MDDKSDAPLDGIENGELFLLRHLGDLRQVVSFICWRNDIRDADAEDFSSEVMLKMIENDYAILRRFESRCSFKNYLVVVVQRLLLDRRNQHLGKWHPSAEAKRRGVGGVLAEKLLRRDRRTVGETYEALIRAGISMTSQEVEDLAARLPERKSRPREVNLEDEDADAVHTDPDLSRADRVQVGRRLSEAVRKTMSRFAVEDQAVIRMHFDAQMSVAEIARALRVPQKPIYRRLQRRLAEIRRSLHAAGIDASSVLEVMSDASIDLDLGLDIDRVRGAPPESGKIDGDVS
jgi:RNA polymerase sigma factor for flagellar operon FliA